MYTRSIIPIVMLLGLSRGSELQPSQVTYESRTQTLTATLGQACFQSAAGIVTCTVSQTIDLFVVLTAEQTKIFNQNTGISF